ncbi:MAG: hypothetical protein H5T59_09145, partial [Anaerolineae bacterium]|nr:hypothetical protein [Anaerolineae bacterium]
MSLRDKMEADRNALEELVAKIPGFRGYKERETRRDADRVLRQHISRLLEEQRTRLNQLQLEVLSLGRVDLLDDLERVGTKVQGVVNRLRTAAYGYAGLFDAVKVDEEQLDALYRFDEGLINLVGQVRDALDDLTDALEAGEELGEVLKGVRETVDRLASTVRGREAVILGEALPDLPEPQ